MINFLHNYLPQPILFQLGFIRVYWYGALVVFGIILGLLVVLQLTKKQGIKKDEVYPPLFFRNRRDKIVTENNKKFLRLQPEFLDKSGGVYDLGFYLIIFSTLGARIYAVLLDLNFYLKNPFEIIAVWHGGLAIHGAIIGGVLTLLIYCYKKNQSFWLWADLIAVAIPLGQALGRWGNYFNQEIFGRPTDLAWGIPISLANRPVEYINFQYFQPTFLYESGLDLVNFGVLLFLFVWVNKKNQELRIKNHGLVFLVYLVNYSLIRIFMEFLRIDPTPEIFGIRAPILVSLGIIIISLGLIIFKIKKIQSLRK
ncbi:MAG: prolipoprotein diacylglyceryl transferase [Patescibacteria group bacterium]|jgi:phosphatidylglycerol:prolipoprotein diacylglycerol transferase